jgi:hypothetical protein
MMSFHVKIGIFSGSEVSIRLDQGIDDLNTSSTYSDHPMLLAGEKSGAGETLGVLMSTKSSLPVPCWELLSDDCKLGEYMRFQTSDAATFDMKQSQ